MPGDTITNQEAIDMMERCKQEIKNLRSMISYLQPKADAYDNLSAVLRLLPQKSMGMGEDITYRIDERIRELTPKKTDEVIGDDNEKPLAKRPLA